MINSYSSWQPLEEVVVGNVWPAGYFDYINDAQVRNQLQQILHESKEDLDNLAQTIKSYGVKVHRPYIIPESKFHFFRERDGIPMPPLTPRDGQISLGQKLLRIVPDFAWDSALTYFRDQIINPHGAKWNSAYSHDCILNGASASCIVRVGTDIFFDNSDFLQAHQSRWIIENCLGPEYRVHEAITDGHGDAVFAILKPGVILSSKHDVNLNFDRDFPGWEVLRIMDSSIEAAMAVGKFKYDLKLEPWYLVGQTPSPEFKSFVDTYLNHWTGHVAETVFDVNCLVLDEENVIFSAYNKQVFDFCERHRINPIISELRHSYFWDGGISCCTQDLRRRGGLETYL
jgi:hypothetical protein